MTRVDWFYAEQGPGQISDIVAHTYATVDALRVHANQIGERAASHLDVRAVRRTGDSHIKVTHSGGSGPMLDSYVSLVDPDGGAAGIEFGWSKVNQEGNEYGHDGLAVLRDAMNEAIMKSKVR